MLGDGIIEIQLPLVAELHNTYACKQLGDGTDAIDRPGRRRHFVFPVGISEAPAPYQFLVVDDPGGNSGNFFIGLLRIQPKLRERGNVRRQTERIEGKGKK